MITLHIGDLWSSMNVSGHSGLAITTNGIVKSNGQAVMGAGFAKQAVDKYGTDLQIVLGNLLKKYGNHVFVLQRENPTIFSFPTKYSYKDNSSLNLIKQSAEELDKLCHKICITEVFMPFPGIGCGKLDQDDVLDQLSVLKSSDICYNIYIK